MLADEIKTRLAEYPLYSQESAEDKIVVAKLFNAFGAGTWYLTEYDPVDLIAFGYVTGLGGDEWGYLSIEEMTDIRFHGAGIRPGRAHEDDRRRLRHDDECL